MITSTIHSHILQLPEACDVRCHDVIHTFFLHPYSYYGEHLPEKKENKKFHKNFTNFDRRHRRHYPFPLLNNVKRTAVYCFHRSL